jgi:transcriptional regulator with PAS, ATPase and Fis domain
MRRLLAMAERVARTNVAVLITGESGTGKELIARAIHHYSLRCGQPWVDVNCGALPDLLMESELFGYERGAFSGAGSTKPGLFEMAQTGSLFLDEIGELPPRMQVKLLRVLDGAPYYRLGGTRKVSVDSRVIAATNQDLEQAMLSGAFRRDLYHRLSQVRLHVPPLRERREDILPLARFFLAQHRAGAHFSDAAALALEKHDWPGNVRELRNLMMQAAVLADGDVIQPADLPLVSAAAAPPHRKPATTLEDMEREMILKVLAEAGGQQQAAEILGISLRTLGRKLKQYQENAERSSSPDQV